MNKRRIYFKNYSLYTANGLYGILPQPHVLILLMILDPSGPLIFPDYSILHNSINYSYINISLAHFSFNIYLINKRSASDREACGETKIKSIILFP